MVRAVGRTKEYRERKRLEEQGGEPEPGVAQPGEWY